MPTSVLLGETSASIPRLPPPRGQRTATLAHQTAGCPESEITDTQQRCGLAARRCHSSSNLLGQIGSSRGMCGVRRELGLHGVGRDAERDPLLLDAAVAGPRGVSQALV